MSEVKDYNVLSAASLTVTLYQKRVTMSWAGCCWERTKDETQPKQCGLKILVSKHPLCNAM